MPTTTNIRRSLPPGAYAWRQEGCAYDLRAALREEFVRCAQQGRVFPAALRTMLARVEAIIASAKRVHRLRARATPAPTTSQPA